MFTNKIVEIVHYYGKFEEYKAYHNEWLVVNNGRKKGLILENIVNKILIYGVSEWRINIVNNEC